MQVKWEYILSIIIGILIFILYYNINKFSISGEDSVDCKFYWDSLGCDDDTIPNLKEDKTTIIDEEIGDMQEKCCINRCNDRDCPIGSICEDDGYCYITDTRMLANSETEVKESADVITFKREFKKAYEKYCKKIEGDPLCYNIQNVFPYKDTLNKHCIKEPEGSEDLSFEEIQKCIDKHSGYSCDQKCSLRIFNDSKKNLQNAGFKHLQNLLDYNDTITLDFLHLLSTGNMNISKLSGLSENMLHSSTNFHFAEFLLLKYLQKKYPDHQVKKIANGVFYINSKIIIFRFSTTPVRLDHSYEGGKKEVIFNEILGLLKPIESTELTEKKFEYLKGIVDTMLEIHSDTSGRFINTKVFPVWHIDFQNYKDYEKYDTDIPNEIFGEYIGSTAVDIHSPALKDYEKILPEKILPNKNIFIGNPETQYLNIWLYLAGGLEVLNERHNKNDGFFSIGFFDIIDDNLLGNHEQSKEQIENTLDNIFTDTGSKRVTDINYFRPGSLINLSNIENDNIQKNIMYSNQLNEGDGYIFKTDSTPHIGIPRDVFNDKRRGFRLSSETRYAVQEKDFNIIEQFVLNDLDNLENIENTFPPPYDKLIPIKFIGEYRNIKYIYQRLEEEGKIIKEPYTELNLATFKLIMDTADPIQYVIDSYECLKKLITDDSV